MLKKIFNLNDNYICALDIGSSKISAVLAVVKNKRITKLFFETGPSKGIQKGAIVDSVELVSAIGKVMNFLKLSSGISVKFVNVNISGEDISTKHSRAIIPLAERGNKVITPSDIRKVNDQARILGSNLEEEIIHQIPFTYTIDSKSNLHNPLGLYSHRLEADLYLVCAKLSTVQSLSRSINQAGLELKDFSLSGIATAHAVFNKELQEGVNILCDIGADITELLIFENGLLRSIEILPFGGDRATQELSRELTIPFELAEDVKRIHTHVGEYERIDEHKEILVKKDDVYRPIKEKLACEIVTREARSLCSSIKEAIARAVSLNNVSNFFVTGRTVILEGFLEELEKNIGIPVRCGKIAYSEFLPYLSSNDNLSGQKYLSYLTSLGIIAQVLSAEEPRFILTQNQSRNPFVRVVHTVKDLYAEYF